MMKGGEKLMKKKRSIRLFLNELVNKTWGKLIGSIAVICIIFALIVPLSHQLIAKNGVVDLAEDLIEKVTNTFGLSEADVAKDKTAKPEQQVEETPGVAAFDLLDPLVPFSTPANDGETTFKKDIVDATQSADENGPRTNDAIERRTVTIQLTTQGGRYPISDMYLTVYGFSEAGTFEMYQNQQTGADGRIVIENVPIGKKYQIVSAALQQGYEPFASYTIAVPPASEHPDDLFFSYSVPLKPFKIVVSNVDENNAPLGGSTFIINHNSQTIGLATTATGSGVATFDNMPTAGSYQLKQVVAPTGYQLLTSAFELSIGQQETDAVQVSVNGVPYEEGVSWSLIGNQYQLSIKVKNIPKGIENPRDAALRIRKVLSTGEQILNTGELIDDMEAQEGLDDVWFAVICLWDKNLSDEQYAALTSYDAAYAFYQDNLDNAHVVKTATLGTAPDEVQGLIELAELPANTLDYGDSRYLILELNDTDHPLPADLYAVSEPLIINLPTLSADNKSYNFNVKVYPKNERVAANVEIFKCNIEGTGLSGAVFDLYKEINGSYTKVAETPASNAAGLISMNGLGVGKYYFKEQIAPAGYQLNPEQTWPFEVTRDEHNQRIPIQVFNDPQIGKPTKSADKASYDFGETVTWTLEQELPANAINLTKFELYDQLDTRLSFVNESVEIVGLERTDFSVTQVVTDGVATIEIKLKPSGIAKLAGQTKLTASLKTIFNSKNPEAIKNTVRVVTSLSDKTSDPAEVITGVKTFRKISETRQPLLGAEFVIRKQVENQILYMKRTAAGTDWVGDIGQATRVISEQNGLFSAEGLAYGDYELLETKAPTSVDGQYGLKSEPVPFTIDKHSYITQPLEIRNYLVPMLPITGGLGITVVLALGLVLMMIALKYYTKEDAR